MSTTSEEKTGRLKIHKRLVLRWIEQSRSVVELRGMLSIDGMPIDDLKAAKEWAIKAVHDSGQEFF